MTADGVEILTARKEDSPGGPIPMPVPVSAVENGVNGKSETS